MLWVSRTFERYFGIERDDVLGRDMRRLLDIQLRDVFAEAETVTQMLLRSYAEKSHPRRFECRIAAGGRRQDRWLEHWSEPIRSGEHAGGRIDYYYDITDRKQAEDSARRSEDQLIQAQKMEAVGRLAGGLAHDFNNLLTAINGYTDLILKAPIDRRLGRYVGEVRKASNRAADLTSKLLTLSRRQAAEQRIVDLNQVVLNLEDLLQRLIGEDIELSTHLDPALERVWVDPAQLEQALLNLAVNARDAMPDGGQLTLETSSTSLDERSAKRLSLEPGGYAVLQVSDTGCGMDPETMSRIFEPFFTTKTAGRGTGLGLSTVKAILEQIGGRITVASELGKGSTFATYLPVIDQTIRDADPGAGRERQDLTGSETILLVEDDEPVRAVIGTMLGGNGYRVLSAHDAKAAIAVLDDPASDVQLLLTDVVMPGLTGPELAEQARAARPDLDVLLMSGYSEGSEGLINTEDDAVVLIQKPFSAEQLLRKLREILQ